MIKIKVHARDQRSGESKEYICPIDCVTISKGSVFVNIEQHVENNGGIFTLEVESRDALNLIKFLKQ